MIRRSGLVLLILIIASVLRLWMLNGGDVTDDEKHYITEAQRLLNKDPYIAIRYHPRKHPEPSIGHPFLYQIEQASIFKVLGLSVYTSRLPNALSGIAIVAIMFMFTKQLGKSVALLAAFFMAILPMAVKYSRNAQLDTVFTLWITLTALSIWKYLNEDKKYWLIAGGVFAGFTISTKLNGVYIVPMVLLLLTFAKGEKLSFNLIKKVFIESLWVGIPAGIISFLLNDPLAYIDGIVNPSFGAYNFFSKEFVIQRIPFLFSPKSFYLFLKVNFLILSPGFLLTAFFALYFLVFKAKNVARRFLLLWIFPFLHLFMIHGLRMDGVYGWIPLIPPVTLAIAIFINRLEKRIRNLSVFGVTILSLPSLFLYGLSLAPVPFGDFPSNHNRTIYQNFYQDTIERVNEITPKNGSVFFLPQVYYPLYALRQDISWSYYGDLSKFDVFVVESHGVLRDITDELEFVEIRVKDQDDAKLSRMIFKKKS